MHFFFLTQVHFFTITINIDFNQEDEMCCLFVFTLISGLDKLPQVFASVQIINFCCSQTNKQKIIYIYIYIYIYMYYYFLPF